VTFSDVAKVLSRDLLEKFCHVGTLSTRPVGSWNAVFEKEGSTSCLSGETEVFFLLNNILAIK